MFQREYPLQCQHVAALLMLPDKKITGNIDEGKMAGEEDAFGSHSAPGRPQEMPIGLQHPGVLANAEPLAQGRQQF